MGDLEVLDLETSIGSYLRQIRRVSILKSLIPRWLAGIFTNISGIRSPGMGRFQSYSVSASSGERKIIDLLDPFPSIPSPTEKQQQDNILDTEFLYVQKSSQKT